MTSSYHTLRHFQEPGKISVVATVPDTTVTPRKRKLIKQLRAKSHLAETRKKKLAAIRSKSWRLQKKAAEQSVIIEQLKAKSLINHETADLLSSINPDNKDFLKRFLCKGTSAKKYSPSLRKFALTLNFISPRAYRFVRKQFDSCLPHLRTLSRWYQTVDGNPGFSKESLKAVKQLNEIQAQKHPSQKLLCALCFDEMAIRKHIDFDGTDCIGFVDYGNNVPTEEMAKDALVFMLTCLNGSWKIPLGYFLINGISADQKANLVKNCIELVHGECGVQIVSVTFDGCPTNFAMAKILGCTIEGDNIDPTFTVGDHKVVIFPDPAHMLKLVRNTIGEMGNIVDGENRNVSWNYVKSLIELQEKESLHMGTKIRKGHVYFKKQIMKVRLAAQILSRSVADAIDYCANKIKIDAFEGPQATVDYIVNFNNLFDIMNSRNLNAFEFKKPINEKNFDDIKVSLQYIYNYIRYIKIDGKNVLETRRKTGFMGFLICIKSVYFLFENYVHNNILKHLCTYKMSQDHIEYFFSCIRAKGGFNNNPTAKQFKAAFNRMLVHGEIKHITSGNCIPLQDIDILSLSRPEIALNKTMAKSRMVEELNDVQPNSPNEYLMVDHDNLADPTRLTEYSKRVIEYIAGFVVGKLKKEINCEKCLQSIIDNKKYNSLIFKKDKGGLNYPTKDVVVICEICEKTFLHNKSLNKKKLPIILAQESAKKCIGLKLFTNNNHFNHNSTENHFPYLIKAICIKYLQTRIYHAAKQLTESDDKVRNLYSKLILFKGQ